MRTEAPTKPKFRDIIEGKPSALKKPHQVDAVKRYHDRIASGTLFGTRTHHILPRIGEVSDSVEHYFNNVEEKIKNLDEEYDLELLYGEEKFASIQDEASRLMWIYGIPPSLLNDHQRGLSLLGAAATLVDLEGRKGETVVKEKHRMHYAVRMIAHASNGTYSTKVDKMVSSNGQKAQAFKEEGEEWRSKKYLKKTRSELQYTVLSQSLPDLLGVNTYGETMNRWLKEALDNKDSDKTSRLGTHTEHIQRIMERLSLPDDTSITWIATIFDRTEFNNKFTNADAFQIDDFLFFPNDIDSNLAHSNQQHELLHEFIQPTWMPYLGRGLSGEADVESNIDVPSTYAGLRLLRYFIDDTINTFAINTIGDTSIARNRVDGAINRGGNYPNSTEEIEWNNHLIDVFGLEGYLTYYLIQDGSVLFDEKVRENLLHYSQGAYRLAALAEREDMTANFPDEFYEGSSSEEEILDGILAIWDQALRMDVLGNLEMSPSSVSEKLSFEQAYELSRRIDAFLFACPEDKPTFRERAINLKKIAWLKKGLPLASSLFYDFHGDSNQERVENYIERELMVQLANGITILDKNGVHHLIPHETSLSRGKPFQLRDLFGGYVKNRVRRQGKNLLDVFPEENSDAVYLSFIHTLSQAVQHNASFSLSMVSYGAWDSERVVIDETKSITGQQRGYAQAVLVKHHRIFAEESGNLSRVIERMKEEVLEPLGRTAEEIVMKYKNIPQVYNAVTNGQVFFTSEEPADAMLTTWDMYNMIEATKLMVGSSLDMPTISSSHTFIETPSITVNPDDRKKVIAKDSADKEEYNFHYADQQTLRQNLLLFIYGYLEKQNRQLDRVVKKRKNDYEDPSDGQVYQSESLLTELFYGSFSTSHFGIYYILRNTEVIDSVTRMARGDQEVTTDLMLNSLEGNRDLKLFDLSDIPGIRDDLERVLTELNEREGEETANRVRRVMEAGIEFELAA